MTELTPTYVDVENGVSYPNNKITLAPKTEKEFTYLLNEHIGKDRNKDAKLISLVADLSNLATDSEVVGYLAAREDFNELAYMALDLDHPEFAGVGDSLNYLELVTAFMDALDFRTSGLRTPEVEEAIKK